MFCMNKTYIVFDKGFEIVSRNEDTNDFIVKDSDGNLYICNITILDTVPVGDCLFGDRTELKK